MNEDTDRERTGPTEEVASEGGSPGEIELNRKNTAMRGSESTSTVTAEDELEEERDRNLTRDDRKRP
jgi:hypothetical protein